MISQSKLKRGERLNLPSYLFYKLHCNINPWLSFLAMQTFLCRVFMQLVFRYDKTLLAANLLHCIRNRKELINISLLTDKQRRHWKGLFFESIILHYAMSIIKPNDQRHYSTRTINYRFYKSLNRVSINQTFLMLLWHWVKARRILTFIHLLASFKKL